MKIRCAHDKVVPITELKPHPKNRNKHPEDQIARLAQILDYQGWRYPVKVSLLSGFITSGHGRIEAAKKNGWLDVPVNYQEYESEEQEYADVQADNAIAAWAELDLAGINTDVGELGPDFDIDLLGIKDFTIDASEKYDGDPDEVPEAPKVAKTKRGELWVLGNHRVLCGDATSREDVERLMAGEKADMVFTDPPYGLGNKKSFNKDHHDYEDSEPFDLTKIEWAGDWLIWGANYYDWLPEPRNEIGWLVWDKRPSREHWDDEVRAAADRRFGLHFEIAVTNVSEVRGKMLRKTWGGFYGTAGNPADEIVHKTQKPIELAERCLQPRHKGVLDCFLGSGSTLIACEKTSRRCFGMEICEQYIDVILSRWAKYTGKDPVREDGVKWSELNGSAES